MMSDPRAEIVVYKLGNGEIRGARAPEWTVLSRGDKVQVGYDVGTVLSSKTMDYDSNATKLVLAALDMESVEKLPKIKAYWRKAEAEWEEDSEDSNEETDGEDGDENDTV